MKINCNHYYGLVKDLTDKQQEQIKLEKRKKKKANHTQEKNTKDLCNLTLGILPQTQEDEFTISERERL